MALRTSRGGSLPTPASSLTLISLNVWIDCGLPSSVTSKSSCFRSWTGLPCRSLTMTSTRTKLMSAAEDRGLVGGWCGGGRRRAGGAARLGRRVLRVHPERQRRRKHGSQHAVGEAKTPLGHDLRMITFPRRGKSRKSAAADPPDRGRNPVPGQRPGVCGAGNPAARPRNGRSGQDAAQPHRPAVRAGRDGHRDSRRARRRRRHLLPCRPRRRGAVRRRSVGRRARRRAEHAGHQRAAALGLRRRSKRNTCRSSRRGPSAPTRCRRPARAATRSRSPRAPSNRAAISG